jgi:hypothetical protein
MAVIKSGASSDLLTIDPTSKAARVTLYNSDGSYNGEKATYRAATIIPFVPAVTINVPWFLIEGSASKTIVVKRIAVSGASLTAVAYLAVNVVKFSTAASGGTAISAPMVPMDSNFPAATAAFVKYYTAVPTAGTIVGSIATNRSLFQSTTAAAAGLPRDYVFDFGDMPETRGIVLRGTTQGCGLIWPVAPATTVTLAVDIEWTEE